MYKMNSKSLKISPSLATAKQVSMDTELIPGNSNQNPYMNIGHKQAAPKSESFLQIGFYLELSQNFALFALAITFQI